jgi:signal transduction histidine kinase
MSASASGRPGRVADGAYQAVAVTYLAGLVIWLVLGVVPPLSDAIGPLERALGSIADGTGPLSLYARRITDQSMASQPVAWVALVYVFSGLNLALGVFLMVKRPRDRVPRLLALAFMGTSATFNEPSHEVFHIIGEPPVVRAIHFTFHVVSGVAYLWAVVLFPDGTAPVGRRLPAPAGRALVGCLTAAVAFVCWRSSFIAHPPFFVAFFGVLVPVVGIVAQTLNLRSGRDEASDEQSRLLRAALLPALAVALFWLAAQGLAKLGVGADATQVTTAVQHVFPAVFAVVPVMMFVAIVRFRLWDIDVIASRALLMASLLTFLAAVYVASLAVTGWLLRGSGWAVVIPLVVVACVAEPVRERLQRLCNRLVYGQQTSPREAVRALVDRFAGTGETDELTELTRAVVTSTRATSAAIWLVRGTDLLLLVSSPPAERRGERRPLPRVDLDACRDALTPAGCWAVMYEGALLGAVAVTTPRGVAVTPVEARLLDDLSHHAGLLVANAQLTVDLQRELDVVTARTRELQESRRRVVQAQDVQRSRLEGDIHDGAQQHLVALLIQLRALQRATDAESARRQLPQLTSVLSAAQQTLARLAAGGAPPVLVAGGLQAALEEAADRARQVGLRVDVRVDRSTAVGVSREATAVYFCCVEALQNIAKHAGASAVTVAVEADPEQVRFRVTDDGVGFSAGGPARGSGMRNLASRLASLGGDVEVESEPGRGTTVRGTVPLPRGSTSVPRQRERVEGSR